MRKFYIIDSNNTRYLNSIFYSSACPGTIALNPLLKKKKKKTGKVPQNRNYSCPTGIPFFLKKLGSQRRIMR